MIGLVRAVGQSGSGRHGSSNSFRPNGSRGQVDGSVEHTLWWIGGRVQARCPTALTGSRRVTVMTTVGCRRPGLRWRCASLGRAALKRCRRPTDSHPVVARRAKHEEHGISTPFTSKNIVLSLEKQTTVGNKIKKRKENPSFKCREEQELVLPTPPGRNGDWPSF